MKKYTLVLFVFTLFITLLGFNIKPASAVSQSPFPAGCTSTVGYSPLTGVKCDSYVNTSLPAGCTSTLGYSPLTGTKCDSPTSNPALPAGCASTLGYSPTTGVKCDSNGVTPSYPPGCTSNQGYSVTTGQSCNNITPQTPVPAPNSLSPVISGVSGPQSLNVNQQRTWAVTAYDKYGGNLSYSVVWGDENVYPYAGANSLRSPLAQQSATFTHSYSQAGNYTPIFTVTNNSGQSAKTSLSVSVGNVVTPPGSLTVLSPNGGETWQKGTTQTISWQDNNNISTHEIKLVSSGWSSTIANTQGSSFNWLVGKMLDNSTFPVSTVPSAIYKIQVCQTGTSVCDSSNSYFTITSGTTAKPNITITDVTCDPANPNVNESIICSVTVYNDSSVNITTPFDVNIQGSAVTVNAPLYAWGKKTVKNPSGFGLTIVGSNELNFLADIWNSVDESNENDNMYTVIMNVNGTTTTPLSITTPSPLPNAKVGNNYIQTIYANSVVNGWSTFGSLPPGMIQGAGTCGDNICNFPAVISGIPTTPGTFAFNVIATSGSQSVTKQFILTVDRTITNAVPTISSLSPSSSVVGSQVTIDGYGFSLTGNAVNFGFGYIPDLTSASGNQIIFTVPESLDLRCRFSNPPCMIMTAMTQPGNYNVSVSNMNGTSNILNFTVVGNVLGATAFHFTQLLQLGSSGNEVLELQKFLNATGYDVGIADGNFGAKTEAAVIKLQTANGLKGDGVVGALTRAALNK